MISHRFVKLSLISTLIQAQVVFGVTRCNSYRHVCEEPCVRRQIRCAPICTEVFITPRLCECVEDPCSRQCSAPCQAWEEPCRERFQCRSSALCQSTSESACQPRSEDPIDCQRCGATLPPCQSSATCRCSGCCLNECRSPCQEPSPSVTSICGCERSSWPTPCESNYASTSCECGCQRSPSCRCP